ncbi:MAG TPA: arsenite methyltransferase [Candidatus Micrarchaeaceae archaeon]|nr:arsenite methyltransferase [Candidatus Micrarchaeaceae archaeon]HVB13258.1 arsenite methyltransferase [Candidatus Dormibacteraeota bacterium]
MGEIKEAVRSRYAELAQELGAPEGCCGSSGNCCPGEYLPSDLEGVGLTEAYSLGCGNPTMLAQLEPGELVLDLGSGGGLDVLLSARRVAPGGHAYGVDMTDEMLQVANRSRVLAGIDNATFLKGTIESVPLPEGTVDVVISNCVINLAEDKGAVLREAFRVLKPGGRLAVADMVELETLAPAVKVALDAWAGCVAGTIPVEKYRDLLQEAGFEDLQIEIHATQSLPEQDGRIGSAYLRARKPKATVQP